MRRFVTLQEAVFAGLPCAGRCEAALESVGTLTEASVCGTLFQVEEHMVLRQLTGKEDIEEAITSWDLVVPSALPLVLVRNKVYQEVAGTWIPRKGLISADGFLYLFDQSRDSLFLEPIFTQQLTGNRLDLELNPQSFLLKLKVRLSRFRSLLKQPGGVVLRMTTARKYESWSTVLTRFVPVFTMVDRAA